MSKITVLRFKPSLLERNATPFQTPPQAASILRALSSRWQLSVHRVHPAWSGNISGQRRSSFSFGSGIGASPPPSLVTSAVGTDFDRGTATPYRWSWQDNDTPAVALEVDECAVSSANSIGELTVALRATIAAAPPRAALTASSRTLLAAATNRLLASTSSSSPAGSGGNIGSALACSISDAAKFLDAYGVVTQNTIVSAATMAAASTATEAPPPGIVASILSHVGALSVGGSSAAGTVAAAVQSATSHDLADLLWALSDLTDDELPWEREETRTAIPAQLGATPAAAASGRLLEARVAEEAPLALQRAVLARVQDQDFLAPDLCRVVCALGSLAGHSSTSGAARRSGDLSVSSTGGSSSSGGSEGGSNGGSGGPGFVADPEVVRALNEEIRYQLTEFGADFEAADLGRLISGMAGLKLGVQVAADEEYRRILMKAVYGKTRSLVDKASVDFALSRLLAYDPEARSMHYDSRWTHEELRWLPRRERDKRRILKEGWYRTRWGGWAPGMDGGA